MWSEPCKSYLKELSAEILQADRQGRTVSSLCLCRDLASGQAGQNSELFVSLLQHLLSTSTTRSGLSTSVPEIHLYVAGC